MHSAVLRVELHLPLARSLKDKRSVLRPILDGARHRFGVAASEVGQHDLWQSAELGFSAVAASAGHVGDVLDSVERFVWSFPEVGVSSCERLWLET